MRLFKTSQDVFEWLEMDPPLCEALTAATGAKSSLRSWARIPAERFADVVKSLMVSDTGVDREQTKDKREMYGGLLSSCYRVLLRVPVQEEARHSNTTTERGDPSVGHAATGAVGSGAAEEGSAGTAGFSESGPGGLENPWAQAVTRQEQADQCWARPRSSSPWWWTRPTTPRYSSYTWAS